MGCPLPRKLSLVEHNAIVLQRVKQHSSIHTLLRHYVAVIITHHHQMSHALLNMTNLIVTFHHFVNAPKKG
jgi:DTW domain-containing protein YfiP